MTEFKLPELGENVHQGDLVRLMVAPGATVAEGQPVMELETDKAVVEVPSSISGTVKDVLVKQGEKLNVGQVIFTIENGNRPTARSSSERAEPGASQPKSAPAQKAPAAPGQKASVAATQPSAPAPARARAIPAVPSETAEVAEFKLPELGENVHQGDLVRLMVSPGTRISAGQPVMELETDKAVVEVPSSITGTVNDVLVKQGDKIKVGQVIFTLQPGAISAGDHQPARADDSHEEGAREAFQAAIQSEGRTEEQALPPEQPRSPAVSTFSMPLNLDRSAGVEQRGPVPAAPHVRRLARELGVDIHTVPGTGPGGRISEDDIKLYTKMLLASAVSGTGQAPATHPRQPALPDFIKWGKIERVSMRGVRRKTAEHLRQAWNTIPHVTQQDRSDITELEQLRAKFAPRAEEAGGKMTVTAIALKVFASALKVFP